MSTVTSKLNLVKPATPEQFSLATYNNNLDIIDLYAVNTIEKLAKGRVYIVKATTVTGAITTPAVINNIATFTFKAGRKYRIVWDTDWIAASANTSAAFPIAFCAVGDGAALTTGLTQKVVRNSHAAPAAVSNSVSVTAYFEPVVDTTTQIKFLAQVDGAGTSLQVQGNRSGAESTYSIYDDGAQY